MIDALRAEWGKTWSVRSSWLTVVGVLVVVSGAALTLANDYVHGISLGEHEATALVPAVGATAPAAQFGLVVFAAFAMLLITSEYSSGSIRSTFLAEPRRTLVVTGKACIAAVVGLFVGTVAGAAGLSLATAALGAHAAPAQEPLLVTSLRVGLVFATSAVLVMGLGVLVRSSVGTLVVALAILVGTAVLPGSVNVWTPGGATGEFVLADDAAYPAATGLLVDAVWAIAVFGAAVWSLRRRDA